MRLACEPDRLFATAELADEFRISQNHLAKVISTLSADGILETRRGGGGGAILARRPEDILLGDVVALLEKNQALVECFLPDGNACTLAPRCQLKQRLAHAEAAFIAYLNRSTLAECVYCPNEVGQVAERRGKDREQPDLNNPIKTIASVRGAKE